MATINTRDWLDYADEMEEEVVEEQVKEIINLKEKHNSEPLIIHSKSKKTSAA